MRYVFTQPPDAVYPSSDNVDGNLVVAKGDYIIKSEAIRYMAIEMLGVGTFGQVFRCVSNEGDEVAIKIVKSCNKFYQYEMNGLRILKKLKDAGMTEFFVELYDAFVYKHHLCVVQGLLKKNIFQVAKIFRFAGFSFPTARSILQQLVEGVCQMQSLGITHCDLKPENVLVSDYLLEKVKIIDFGSSSTRPVSTVYYVQSRFYRAPEVILGIPYNSMVDIWSLGCIAYELLMGTPLFPGTSNEDQVHKISEFIPGGIPQFMLDLGVNTAKYFKQRDGVYQRREDIRGVTCDDVIEKMRSRFGPTKECQLFIDFMLLCLEPSYLERSSPYDLRRHPLFSCHTPTNIYPASRDDLMTKEWAMSARLGERKTSVYEANTFEEEDERGVRKTSLFDPSHENKYNWR